MNSLTMLFAVLVAWLSIGTFVAAEGSRPNVLYIFTDDQTTRSVSCYPDAYPWVKTPNIDALAAQGVRFENVYMAAYCVPSRVSFLTGNLPHAARGVFTGRELDAARLTEEEQNHPFWPRRLRASGYRTGIIGKWHVNSRPPTVGMDWDTAIHWSSQSTPGGYYEDQHMRQNGGPPTPLNGYSVDRHTDMAVDFINSSGLKSNGDGGKPWLLWLCYSSPHKPCVPAPRHRGLLKDVQEIPEPASISKREGQPAYIATLPEIRRWDNVKGQIRAYQECVLAIDENVGRLMRELNDAGQLENTVVIFASDQGIAYGQHGLVGKKDAPYDATLRGPLIFRWPGHFAENHVVHDSVNATDVVRTLHEITGLAPLPTMDGMSLVPVLENPDHKLGRDAMLLTNVQNNMGQSIPQMMKRTAAAVAAGEKGEAIMYDWTMIRSGDYKYVAYAGPDREEEIYDLKHDPDELNNLAGDPEHKALLKELRKKAAVELRKTQSGFDDGHFIDFFPLLRRL
ncbi:Choline-sulfatase [Caulifigura coniformis]|uniref:Choline-sulfatase n=1 Tax=Caulifigura coniformis TaxID=2527983 RepID=A0A517SBI9_9PLAN|nr:sulfatase-like hydrolase/transferase [Caulifigura coniformis]QDT53478.1 Choline-sulfatase [Caulifigura coniformis]